MYLEHQKLLTNPSKQKKAWLFLISTYKERRPQRLQKKTSSFNYCIIFVKIFYILDQKHAFFTSKKENYFEEMLVIINALLHVIV